jgi:hypothetical protein
MTLPSYAEACRQIVAVGRSPDARGWAPATSGNSSLRLGDGSVAITVPAGTPHWFDMGPRPRFMAIRLFTNPEGWVAHYTGSGIAARFPRHEPVAA